LLDLGARVATARACSVHAVCSLLSNMAWLVQGFVEIEDKAAKQAEEEELDDEDWTDLERFQVPRPFLPACTLLRAVLLLAHTL
jgi:hypothetical protein